MKRTWITAILVFVLGLAFVLRFYKVTSNPPSLNWDEVSMGYNAYSVLETGRDEWGKFLPIHFKSYGEYKLPGQIYASIPAIAIFGLNPLGVRITPVIYGTLTILLVYLLGVEFFKKKSIALLSAFFLAISPWHIQLTRASFESSFALFWVVLAMIFFVKGFKESKFWLVAVFPFVFAMYTYNSARVFVPLFLLFVAPFYIKEILKAKRSIITAGIIFTIFIIPIISFVLSGEGSARYKLVSVTDEAGLVPRVEEARNYSSLKSPFKELLLNRYTYVSYSVVKNYLAHFTPNFLFIKGAGHVQHHPQKIGELYWIQAPFLLLGLYLLFKSKNKYRWVLIVWLLTAFIPVAFTIDSIPHALRTLNAAPIYQFLTALGVVGFVDLSKKRKTLLYSGIAISSILLTYQFVKYQIYFYREYPVMYSRDWQYGNNQAVDFIKDNYDKYDLIVYTREYGEPHMFTLFYLNYPPERYQNDPGLVRYELNDWVWVERFDKFYFPDLGDSDTTIKKIREKYPDKKILFIGTDSEINDSENIIKNIKFLNGKIAFQIVE